MRHRRETLVSMKDKPSFLTRTPLRRTNSNRPDLYEVLSPTVKTSINDQLIRMGSLPLLLALPVSQSLIKTCHIPLRTLASSDDFLPSVIAQYFALTNLHPLERLFSPLPVVIFVCSSFQVSHKNFCLTYIIQKAIMQRTNVFVTKICEYYSVFVEYSRFSSFCFRSFLFRSASRRA